jgi:hypothetical protein
MSDVERAARDAAVEEVLAKLQERFPHMELTLAAVDFDVLGQTIRSVNVLHTREKSMGLVINSVLAVEDTEAAAVALEQTIRFRWDPEKEVVHRELEEFPMVLGYCALTRAESSTPIDIVLSKQLALIQVMDNWRCGMVEANDAIEAFDSSFVLNFK